MVLTMIHTFGAVIEQLSLAIEMVKCSHAGPSNKSNIISMNIFQCSHIGKWELIHTLE